MFREVFNVMETPESVYYVYISFSTLT